MTKRLLINWLYFIGIGAGLLLPACRKTAGDLTTFHPIGDTKTDTLLCYNLLPDSSYTYLPSGTILDEGYVLYINDSINQYIGRGLHLYTPCYGISPAIPISAEGGTYTLKLIYWPNDSVPPSSHPNPARIVAQKTISVPPHSGYGHIVFYDSAGRIPTISYMPVTTADPGAPAPGTFKLRVVNYGYSYSASDNVFLNSAGTPYAVQLQYSDSSIVKGNTLIPFGGSSDYQQFKYGLQQFMVYNTTNQSYFTNSGPLNDLIGTFDLSYATPGIGSTQNTYVFPNLVTQIGYAPNFTTQIGDIGSYPFAAGGCYSIYVFGDIYAVALDRMYGAGTLDNVGKIQVVNGDPDAPTVQVTMSMANGESQQLSVAYGDYAEPAIVPAGPVTCTFTSNGQTIATYTTSMERLAFYTLYLALDPNNLPLVFPQNTTIDPVDYSLNCCGIAPNTQITHVFFLDLCSDAGNVFFTSQAPYSGEVETVIPQSTTSATVDLGYKGAGQVEQSYSGTKTPDVFNLHLSASRKDSLSRELIATLEHPFSRMPSPGSYTLVSVGQVFATEPARQPKLILVPHTNFISKAL